LTDFEKGILTEEKIELSLRKVKGTPQREMRERLRERQGKDTHPPAVIRDSKLRIRKCNRRSEDTGLL